MRKMLFALLLASLCYTQAVHAAPDYRAINSEAVQAHILPRLAKLQSTTRAFADAAKPGCGEREALRRGWQQAMLAWQGVQHLRFGPVLLFNRYQRFAYWPDPRNSIPRQMNELFASGKLPDFHAGSIAVQGMGALERVLFDGKETAKLEDDAFRCQWLQAATENLAGMAKDINDDWGKGRNYAQQFVAAKGDLVVYAGPEEATLDLFKALHAAVELVADHKLNRPMGKSLREQKPMAAEYWRSGMSGAAIAANIAAARELFAAMAAKVPDRALAADLSKRFDDLASRTAALHLEDALADPSARPGLEKLRADLLAVKSMLAEKLAPTLEIPVGFNALDGD
ncbi:imelysin family protein [Ferrovibrio sp.]|uniref:imelysin family protein n=1 Tax=Ferrovibrio sp. TaxID=1917215 RepID=UPI0025C26980|nr:imelysin family protein [Ferrovibrio sp.]MBX3453249.1 imelysin family protein [Ferrovibrio sp.]